MEIVELESVKPNILLTTAISYTNGSPHIGHLYESVLADFIKKTYEITGYQVKLLTGTDEHGKKIQTTSQELQIKPIELCDKYSKEFEQMNKNIGTDYDYFIRTTENIHVELVTQSITNILDAQSESNKPTQSESNKPTQSESNKPTQSESNKPTQSESNKPTQSIYLTEYSGYYNIREECYITDLQASRDNWMDPISKKPYEIVKEPTYNFVLETHQEQINRTIAKVIPIYFQDEIKSRLLGGLEDLSITRTSFTWGIPFPNSKSNPNNNEQNHVIYVWFDALLNYVTGKKILYGDKKVLPIHLIGKDIQWFHTVIYPAILEELGYADLYPHQILTHGFILDKNGRKMSKSLGNTITNSELLNTYPIEAIRYYLITNTNLGQDFKFDPDNLVGQYNNILIKDFGNLFQRLLKIIKPIQSELNEFVKLNNQKIMEKKSYYKSKLENFLYTLDFIEYNNILSTLMDNSNKTLTEKKPWTLEKQEQVLVLGKIILDYNIIICMMYPIIPSKVRELAGYLGWAQKINMDLTNITICIEESTNKIIAFESIKKTNPIQSNSIITDNKKINKKNK